MSNKQYDQIERLYFRYTLCTRSLLDIVNAYKDISNKAKFKKNNAQAFILGYSASLTLYKHSAELILKTAGNELLINKLNEEYPRTEIKGDGLNYIISNLTEPNNIKNIDIANEFLKEINFNETRVAATPQSVKELIKACENYPKLKNSSKITFEYVMLKDINDSEEDANKADGWFNQGYTEILKTPDDTVIFVTEKNSIEIRKDQKDCMGCLSQCKFSNWSDNEENKYSTGKKVDPRSFCIQKTLQNVAHFEDPENELMFAGHNAWKFKQDPFYSNGFVPTVKELVNRIASGD